MAEKQQPPKAAAKQHRGYPPTMGGGRTLSAANAAKIQKYRDESKRFSISMIDSS